MDPLIVDPLIVEPLIVDPLLVDPPIVGPLNKGHNINNLSIKDASLGPKCSLSYSTYVHVHLQPPKRGPPPFKAQNDCVYSLFIVAFCFIIIVV